MPHNNGGDWIRLHKRLAIYHRDGHDCVWCRSVFPLRTDGYGLTLDHVFGARDNRPENLVSACRECNSSRRDTPADEWAAFLALRGHDPVEVMARVRHHLALPLDVQVGFELAKARRPNYALKGAFGRCNRGAWSRGEPRHDPGGGNP